MLFTQIEGDGVAGKKVFENGSGLEMTVWQVDYDLLC